MNYFLYVIARLLRQGGLHMNTDTLQKTTALFGSSALFI